MQEMKTAAILSLNRPLLLATASPARRQLVADAGLAFTTQVVDIDESPRDDEAVAAYVERLARAKAEAVVPPSLDALIVTVDTAIGFAGRIIGKAVDTAHARAILSQLSGRTHEVVSAIAVRDLLAATIEVEVVRTVVAFSPLTDAMIEWYLATNEWKGKAGAYAIQGKGASLVAEVRGCFTNVIGFSMPALLKMLGRCEGSPKS